MRLDTDKRHHPWPSEGKWFEFRLRRAVWMSVRPWYHAVDGQFDHMDVRRMFVLRFWFPFFTYNIKIKGYGVHGYIGWKPIPVGGDPQFGWRQLNVAQRAIEADELFVQLSWRGGIGGIS
jgi:hypothetical protein